MSSLFTETFFAGNRDKLRKACAEDAPIAVAGNAVMQRNGVSNYPFRQDANFWYLTGINEPMAVLVIDVDETYIILPQQNDYQEYFDGQSTAGDIKKVSGIEKVYVGDEGWEKLKVRMQRSKKAYYLTPPDAFIELYGTYANPWRIEVKERLAKLTKNLELIDFRDKIVKLRMVKQPVEIKAMQKAVDITCQAFAAVKKAGVKTEREIEAFFTSYFVTHGARHHAYEPIVADGKNACLIHYGHNHDKLKKNQLTLMDIGAEFENYASDITRTFALHGKPTKRQKEVYDAVFDVQNKIFEHLKPGMSIRDSERLVEEYMGEKLLELGVIEQASREEIRKYYPHAASHFIGLDTHDAGDYDAPLEPNMAFTVEPGIYIPEEGIGVRIEDDVLMTDKGIVILSKQLPREL